MKESIIEFYKLGFYTNESFKTFVQAKWITVEEFESVTKVDYETLESLE